MTEERNGSSQRLSGVAYGPTTALWRQHEPHAIDRGMLIGPLDSQDPLPHIESLHALDWLNFSIAALLMGFGPFVAVRLANRGWVPANIGLVLPASEIAGLLTHNNINLL